MTGVQLHMQTEYSLLQSTCRVQDLVDYAYKKNVKALAITDRNVLYGAVPFMKACREKGIHPVIGLKLDLVIEDEKAPLLLLAQNDEGYRTLIRLSTKVRTSTEAPIYLQELAAQLEGLFVIVPHADSEVAVHWRAGDINKAGQLVEALQTVIPPGQLFFEVDPVLVQKSEEEKKWLNWGREKNCSFVLSSNIHQLKEADKQVRKLLEAIRKNKAFQQMEQSELELETSFEKAEEVVGGFSKELKERTLEVALSCQVKTVDEQMPLPVYPLDAATTASDQLKKLTYTGMKARYGQPSEQVQDRLKYELEVIERMGYADYFLIVWDMVRFAKRKGMLVGPGRGSAAGSLVAYVLYITDVDPLQFNLLFERFLNPERVSMPDIDVDFPDHRREEVIRYLIETYGDDYAAQIITFGTFGYRAALRDTARMTDAPRYVADRIIKALPKGVPTLKEAYSDEGFKKWMTEDEATQQVFSLAVGIEGLPRHASIHAAGVILSHDPLSKHVPLELPDSQAPAAVTQYPMEILEEKGLLKMDVLGLRNLTLLEQMAVFVQQLTGKPFSPADLSLEDPETFKLLAKGETLGIFQFESSGMQNVLKRLQPTEFEDLVAVNALYRPGPMEQIPVYIDGKHGKVKPSWPHPDLKPYLAHTYGVMVYQEQVMQIANVMGGFSFGEADLLRRAVSKKDQAAMEEMRERFLAGAEEKGYDDQAALQVYEWIVRFGNYGFNRSHAVAYSKIAYQLAYVKAHYPLIFYAALLTNVRQNDEKINAVIREMKRQGYTILPPSINRSHLSFLPEDNGLRWPLTAIRHVNEKTAQAIITERDKQPFTHFLDVFLRLEAAPLTREGLISLIKAGAFDDFNMERTTLLASLDRAREFADFHKDVGSLFGSADTAFRYAETDPYSFLEKLEAEREATGYYLSDHPLSMYRTLLEKIDLTPLRDLPTLPKKSAVKAVGLVESIRQIRTKTGQPMAFLVLTDGEKDVEIVVFPDVYREVRAFIEEKQPILIKGEVDTRANEEKIIAKEILSLEWLKARSKEMIYVKVEAADQVRGTLAKLDRLIDLHRGPVPITLYYEEKKQAYRLPAHKHVDGSSGFFQRLTQLFDEEQIKIQKA
ncbi:DNA polymerase III subunit alpha [Salsuginibacillus kocurii]|uniref:DNA polymerase III subunit alpha n=1 Tax=Salsuginibacillus kocurii TaxID=427078 RepID=UPI0003770437|nr:DNA polymerase III subunit alpha [Salsuginibacillus kocurii]